MTRRGVWGAARRSLTAGLLVSAAGLAGCTQVQGPVTSGPVTSGPAPSGPVTLTVTPSSTRADAPNAVRLSGVAAGATVLLTVSATDAAKVTWTGTGTYIADSSGRVDADTAPSSGGTVKGVHPMGLVSSMQPPAGSTDPYFAWPDSLAFTWSALIGGAQVAQVTTTRIHHVEAFQYADLTVAHDGIAGVYASVPDGHRHPAVLLLGGSGGGYSALLAGAFAERGIPTLAQAYFKEPGLPTELRLIPLETFDRGLAYLQAQPDVDPAQIWVVGASRGSEAALLVAARRTDVVHGVVATSPSSVVHGSNPTGGSSGWTLGGKPLPYVETMTASGSADPATVIPVERIAGPVVMVCGGSDTLWSSCAYSKAIVARLVAAGRPYPHPLLEYAGAGHLVDELLPYTPELASGYHYGISQIADADARAEVWPQVVADILGATR